MTVLSQASLTTTPCSTRFDITPFPEPPGCAVAQHGLDTRNIPPYLAHASGVLELAVCALEAQVEDFLAQVVEFAGQLVLGLDSNVACLHQTTSAPSRATNRVPIGSLAAASSNASRAVSADTPSSSNMMRPGLIRQIQNSGDPLPLPMRTSAGLCETGTSGNTRIHTRPARRICRVIARRAASICRAVIRPGSAALRP